ncbi:TPA: RusA family crossover junction endodeoxyribonuclease [Staphylococcus pseudintermedius]|nr:RusA family crossover junction endodeoxyribonuclease [Staphylococcus pseudintermedius]
MTKEQIEITVFYEDTKDFEKPMGSPRPRFRNTGRFVQTYMPTKYTKHKEYIAKQMPDLKNEAPIKVTVEFHFPFLKSWSKKKCERIKGHFKETKPDLDNLLKTVLDAGNQKLWKDDNQIVELHSLKKYNEIPHTKIVIEEVQ